MSHHAQNATVTAPLCCASQHSLPLSCSKHLARFWRLAPKVLPLQQLVVFPIGLVHAHLAVRHPVCQQASIAYMGCNSSHISYETSSNHDYNYEYRS